MCFQYAAIVQLAFISGQLQSAEPRPYRCWKDECSPAALWGWTAQCAEACWKPASNFHSSQIWFFGSMREGEKKKKTQQFHGFFIWEQVLVFTGSCMFLLLWPACKGCNPSSATLYYSPPHFLAHRKFDIFRKISPRFAGADLQQHSSQLFKSHYFGLKR